MGMKHNPWDHSINQAIRQLSDNDPVMGRLIEQYPRCTLQPHNDYYGALLDAIIGQQLSEKAGAAIVGRFKELFDDSFPAPQQIIETDTEAIRGIGVSYAKVRCMKDLAQHIIDGRLDLENIATLPNETAIEQLVSVKGIGEWTAHMFLIFCVGELDILPVGDLGIRKAMMKQYDLSELPDRTTMELLTSSKHWHPYESVAAWYLWRSLDNQQLAK